ncbi:MAG: hypothetical protein SFT81_06910 [Candidatus Caenarcaniphilales bacterium]|nr:hypothetical protein [Candidatus Caenarcaniphilales bacterium]
MMQTVLVLFFSFAFLMAGAVRAETYYPPTNTFDPRDGYFQTTNDIRPYYRPRNINPLIAMLPEYALSGPGYICELHQAPPVYRIPMRYYRNVGYREADWRNNRILDRHTFPVNFGGYNY